MGTWNEESHTCHLRAAEPEVCWIKVKHDMCAAWEWQNERLFFCFCMGDVMLTKARVESGVGAAPPGAKTSFINLKIRSQTIQKLLFTDLFLPSSQSAQHISRKMIYSQKQKCPHILSGRLYSLIFVSIVVRPAVWTLCELGFTFLPSGRR